MTLTTQEYLDKHAAWAEPGELTNEIRGNAARTVAAGINLLAAFGKQRALRSGWRPKAFNARLVNAAGKSLHMTGEAIDLEDEDGELREFCMANLSVLESLGLYMEHPGSTKGWCHVQIVSPKSGKRVFYP
jgi:hypothetical protein